MTWFRDLEPCDYFGAQHAHYLRAVGWLSPTHDFPKGRVSQPFLDRLRSHWMLWSIPQMPGFLGGIFCSFCPGQVGFSAGNMFVPGNRQVYVAPEGIIHYIEEHRYRPPEEFQTAVLECPPGDTFEYFEAIASAAPDLGGAEPMWEMRQDLLARMRKRSRND